MSHLVVPITAVFIMSTTTMSVTILVHGKSNRDKRSNDQLIIIKQASTANTQSVKDDHIDV